MGSGPYPLFDGMYREYHPTWGRWISPDPAGLSAASPANPQTWNRYAYVANNPLGLTDPSGLCPPNFSGFGNGVCVSNYTNGQLLGDPGEWQDPFDQFGDWTYNEGPVWVPDLPDQVVDDSIAELPIGGRAMPPVTLDILCRGTATFTAVGGKQAMADGALYSLYPQRAGGSIRGGTFGTVAVQNGFLGLTTRRLRTYGTQISVTPDNQALISQYGGPTGPLSVSDYGDANVQATAGTAFDLYRFPTVAAGMQFGRQVMGVTITAPSASGANCPSGFSSSMGVRQ